MTKATTFQTAHGRNVTFEEGSGGYVAVSISQMDGSFNISYPNTSVQGASLKVSDILDALEKLGFAKPATTLAPDEQVVVDRYRALKSARAAESAAQERIATAQNERNAATTAVIDAAADFTACAAPGAIETSVKRGKTSLSPDEIVSGGALDGSDCYMGFRGCNCTPKAEKTAPSEPGLGSLLG